MSRVFNKKVEEEWLERIMVLKYMRVFLGEIYVFVKVRR